MFGSLSQVLVSQCWCLLHQLKINVSEPHLMVSVAHRFLRKPAAPLSQSYQYSTTVKTTFQKFAAEAGMQHPLPPTYFIYSLMHREKESVDESYLLN